MGLWLLVLIWIVAAIWLLLVWFIGYILEPGPLKARLDAVHVAIRHAATAVLLGVGVYSLLVGGPVATRWLAATKCGWLSSDARTARCFATTGIASAQSLAQSGAGTSWPVWPAP